MYICWKAKHCITRFTACLQNVLDTAGLCSWPQRALTQIYLWQDNVFLTLHTDMMKMQHTNLHWQRENTQLKQCATMPHYHLLLACTVCYCQCCYQHRHPLTPWSCEKDICSHSNVEWGYVALVFHHRCGDSTSHDKCSIDDIESLQVCFSTHLLWRN